MQRQGQVLDTSIVSRRKLPLLALVDSFPCCAILSRRTIPSSRKFPIIFSSFFWFDFLMVSKNWNLRYLGSIEQESVD